MEVMKQMYDIASLFDVVEDLSIARDTYKKLARLELEYREKDNVTIEDVAMDTILSAQCISIYGFGNKEEFQLYSDGIDRIKNFIHSERYIVPLAIRKAARAAYAAACMIRNVDMPARYNGDALSVQSLSINAPLSTKLEKLKKTNPEAFFYWYQTSKLLKVI